MTGMSSRTGRPIASRLGREESCRVLVQQASPVRRLGTPHVVAEAGHGLMRMDDVTCGVVPVAGGQQAL